MSHISTARLRKLLTSAFSDEDLDIFCFDHFRVVYNGFTSGMSKPQKIQRLIEHCDRTGTLAPLYERVAEERPTYCEPAIATPSPTPPPPAEVPLIARINPLFPITAEEWRAEKAKRNQQFGNPPGYWCYVRPAVYPIGGWEVGDVVESVRLPGFWIAKYPITVQQYRQFIASGGYDCRACWTEQGWAMEGARGAHATLAMGR